MALFQNEVTLYKLTNRIIQEIRLTYGYRKSDKTPYLNVTNCTVSFIIYKRLLKFSGASLLVPK